MNCCSCSVEIPDNSAFCLKCGTKQNTVNSNDQVDAIEEKLNITNHSFTSKGRIDCQQWIEEFGFNEVAKAVDISLSQYLRFDIEDNPLKDSVDIVFSKIPGICANRKNASEKPYLGDSQHLVAYANKKFYLSEKQERDYKDHANRLLYLFYQKAADYPKMFEELFWKLKKSNDKWEFLNEMEELVEVWEVDN